MANTEARGAAHVSGGHETPSKLSYDGAVAVKEFPAVRPMPHVETVARSERGDGRMHWAARGPVPGKAEEDVPKAEPPIAVG